MNFEKAKGKQKLIVSCNLKPKSVATTIIELVHNKTNVELYVTEDAAIKIAIKSIIIARSSMVKDGLNLMCIPRFSRMKMDEKTITGIKISLVVSRETKVNCDKQETDKLTEEEIQTLRVKIANMVARDKTIDRRCCICGKENAEILHNQENPYFITFLCRTCRTNEDNVKKAEKTRFNLREHKSKLKELSNNKTYLHTNQYTPETVKNIVDRYLFKTQDKNFGEYCKEIGLSRYQFNSVLDLYSSYFPEDKGNIYLVYEKSKAVQRERISIRAKYRELQKRTKKYKQENESRNNVRNLF